MMTAFICNYGLSLRSVSVFSRHDTRFFLEYLREILRSVKPTAKAILVSVSSVLRNISHASLIRIWRTKSTGVIPVVAFTHYI